MKRSYESARRRGRARIQPSRWLNRYRYVRLRWRLLFVLLDTVGWFVVRLLARLRRNRACGGGPPRSILLVQLDHLGDAVLTTAVLAALRRRFLEARIETLTSEWNRELFLACPEINRVHTARVSRFSRTRRGGWVLNTLWWGWRLRRRHFDLAIDLRGEFPLALMLWLTGAKRRLGWDCGGGGFLLTDRAHYQPGRPEVESRLALLRQVGVTAGPAEISRAPWLDPGPSARQRIERRLDALGAPFVPLVVLHVGAGTQAKRWPVAHWRELLGRLVVEYGGRVVLIGVPGEKHLASAVTGGLEWPGVADWSGTLSLMETAALIRHADAFVGADSGPAHLAAAVGTPAIVLFSGTNRARQWRPWGTRLAVVRERVACSPCHREQCLWREHPCMTGISPRDVMRRIAALVPWLSANSVESVSRPAAPRLETLEHQATPPLESHRP